MTKAQSMDILDCSTPSTAVFWAVLGMLLAGMVHLMQAPSNMASLLRVGTANPLYATIDNEIGPLVPAGRIGHDGQLYYLVARDPFARGETVRALAVFDQNPPRYRYRRILFPFMAGGAGYFSPRMTVVGMIFWTVVGMGLTAVGVADVSHSLRLSAASALAALLNLGGLVSVALVTADVLALGLALIGIALCLRRRLHASMLVLALASLAKETYLLVPVALALSMTVAHPRRAFFFLFNTTLPLACWSLWLWMAVPANTSAASNMGLPLQGLSESASSWVGKGLDGVQAVFAGFIVAAAALASAGTLLGRHAELRWLAGSWVVLAGCAGFSVWIFPTNAARAFPILWPLGVLLVADWIRHGSTPKARQTPRGGT